MGNKTNTHSESRAVNTQNAHDLPSMVIANPRTRNIFTANQTVSAMEADLIR